MSEMVAQTENAVADLLSEPRVLSQAAPRAITHTVALIPPNHVPTMWGEVAEHLVPAVERSRGRWDMESLYLSMCKMEQNLWVTFNDNKVVEGVGVTEFIFYPKKKMLSVQFLGGNNFNAWVWEMLERFNSWASDNECDGVEMIARHGFWKWLEQDGFVRSYTTYEKEV